MIKLHPGLKPVPVCVSNFKKIPKGTYCQCGHVVEEHTYYNYGIVNPCFKCGASIQLAGSMHDFKQDNLKYIEQKYEESLK